MSESVTKLSYYVTHEAYKSPSLYCAGSNRDWRCMSPYSIFMEMLRVPAMSTLALRWQRSEWTKDFDKLWYAHVVSYVRSGMSAYEIARGVGSLCYAYLMAEMGLTSACTYELMRRVLKGCSTEGKHASTHLHYLRNDVMCHGGLSGHVECYPKMMEWLERSYRAFTSWYTHDFPCLSEEEKRDALQRLGIDLEYNSRAEDFRNSTGHDVALLRLNTALYGDLILAMKKWRASRSVFPTYITLDYGIEWFESVVSEAKSTGEWRDVLLSALCMLCMGDLPGEREVGERLTDLFTGAFAYEVEWKRVDDRSKPFEGIPSSLFPLKCSEWLEKSGGMGSRAEDTYASLRSIVEVLYLREYDKAIKQLPVNLPDSEVSVSFARDRGGEKDSKVQAFSQF